MSALKTFMAYAREFENTYEDDDWGRLERFFADDAIYEVTNVSYGCRLQGPEAILRGIKKSLDGFDRQMDSRKIDVLAPPRAEGSSLEIDWAVTYTLGEAPPIRVEAMTTATLEGRRITHLADHYREGQEQNLRAWIAAHGPHIDPSYT